MNPLPPELLEYVNHGREERNLECKEALSLQGRGARAKLAKELMALSNIRDGGVIVVGVTNEGTAVGMPEEDAVRLTHDAVAAAAADYVAPYVELTVTAGHDDAAPPKHFVVIQVKEFAETPILCKRDYPGVVRQGAVYVRSRRLHEATEIRTEADMRELIEMAVDKGVRAFNRRASAAGFAPSTVPSPLELYERQLGGL